MTSLINLKTRYSIVLPTPPTGFIISATRCSVH
jgi:hypothetical protein